MMNKKISVLSCLGLVFLLSGCGTNYIPKYEVNADNIDELRKHPNIEASVGSFSSNPPELSKPLTIRAINKFASPYENSFAKYIEEALKLELNLADKYNPEATVKVSGVLIKQNLDSNSGTGQMEVTFNVVRKGKLVYEITVIGTHSFETSILGAIAIPNTAKAYPPLVSNVLNKLFKDKQFIQSISK